MPLNSAWGCLTYPPYCAEPKSRHVTPPIAPSFCIGPVEGQKFLKQLLRPLAGEQRRLGADGGNGAAWQDILEGRRRLGLGSSSQTGEHDKGQIVQDVVGRIRIHGGRRTLSAMSP